MKAPRKEGAGRKGTERNRRAKGERKGTGGGKGKVREKAAKRSSYKGRRANALASGAEERRGKLRKATGSRKQAESRRYLNGAIRRESCPGILW